MIIDLILDRKDGDYYDAISFYNNVIGYEKSSNIGNSISKAFKSGKERNVKQALIDYIDENGYNNSIKKYIQSVDWLVSDNELEERAIKTYKTTKRKPMKIKRRRFFEKARIDEDDRVKALADFLELSEDEYDVIEPSRYGDNLFEYGKREYYVLTDDEADDVFKEMQEQLLDDLGFDSFASYFQDWIMDNAIDADKFWKDHYNDIAYPIESNPDEEENLFDEDEIKDFLKEYVEKDEKNNKKEFLRYIRDAIDELDSSALDLIKSNSLSDFDYISSSFTDSLYDYFNIEDEDLENEDEKSLEKKLVEYYDNFIEEIDDANLSDCLKVVDALGEIDRFIEGAVDTFIGFYDSPANYLQEMGYGSRDLFEALEPYLDIDMIIEEIKNSDGRGPTIAGYDGDENEVDVDGETYYIYRAN